MKRAVAFSFFLACSGLLLGNPADARGPSRQSASLLDDVVRLTRDGLSDETVLAYAKAHRGELPPVVTSDRLLWLRESGVSETVIRYLTAIDVRAVDEEEAEDTAYDSDEVARYPSAAYSSAGDDYDGDYYGGGDYDSGYYNSNSYDSYPDSDYASFYAGDYPFYGGNYYPYPSYFFVNRGGFRGRFHRRDHGFRRNHRDADHRRGFGRRDFSRDRRVASGFDRSSRGRRGGVVVGQGWRERQAIPRGGFGQVARQPRSIAMGRNGPGRPAGPRRDFGPVSRGPRGGIGGHGGGHGAFGRPSFSGGGRAGAAVGRAPIARSGGGPRGVAGPGGRTRP
jgi:hypothetical protein